MTGMNVSNSMLCINVDDVRDEGGITVITKRVSSSKTETSSVTEGNRCSDLIYLILFELVVVI